MAFSKQHLDYFATVAEIVAAIGVMVSVIYLAIQIDGSNKELRAQSYNDALALVHLPLELLVQDQKLSDIVRKGGADPASLSEAEWFRYSRWQLLRFDGYEYTYYANQTETIPTELWLGMNASFSTEIRSNPGFRKFWEEYGHAFAEPFHSFVEAKFQQQAPLTGNM